MNRAKELSALKKALQLHLEEIAILKRRIAGIKAQMAAKPPMGKKSNP